MLSVFIFLLRQMEKFNLTYRSCLKKEYFKVPNYTYSFKTLRHKIAI